MELLISFCFLGGLGFCAWAMGWRCAEAREALLLRHARDFRWAVQAFYALLIFSFMAMLVSWLVLGYAALQGRMYRAVGMALISAWVPLVTAWTFLRVSRAAEELP
jgi:hypothetical protein